MKKKIVIILKRVKFNISSKINPKYGKMNIMIISFYLSILIRFPWDTDTMLLADN